MKKLLTILLMFIFGVMAAAPIIPLRGIIRQSYSGDTLVIYLYEDSAKFDASSDRYVFKGEIKGDELVIRDSTLIEIINANSSGSGVSVVEILYADLQTLIGTNSLVVGTFYKVTDRGDRWIMFQAVSVNQLATEGQRLMLCPADYTAETDGSGNTWIGVWNDTKSVSIGELTIWGGLVWENLTGVIGTSVDDVTLDAVNWLVISKSSFANDEYIEMLFGIQYDWTNDLVLKQWDDKNNIISSYGITPSSCNSTDWNYGTSGYDMYENQANQISNNSNAGEISYNKASLIKGNSNNGDITENIMDSGFGHILNNSNGASISLNKCGTISSNSGSGAIVSNDIIGQINNNTSSLIGFNTNLGSITDNTNVGFSISANSNQGDIYNNSNPDVIQYNSNLGNIADNANNGEITFNSNLGFIEANTVNVTLITLNSNAGFIGGNDNTGEITSNKNLGDIDSNSNLGNILLNRNSGGILSVSSVVPVNVYNNINNGIITGLEAADVTDPIVNK